MKRAETKRAFAAAKIQALLNKGEKRTAAQTEKMYSMAEIMYDKDIKELNKPKNKAQ